MSIELILTDIKWDTDGQTVEECELPTTVIVLGVTPQCFKDGTTRLTDDAAETISTALSDAFGFCHQGFMEDFFTLNDKQGFYADRIGIMRIVMPL